MIYYNIKFRNIILLYGGDRLKRVWLLFYRPVIFLLYFFFLGGGEFFTGVKRRGSIKLFLLCINLLCRFDCCSRKTYRNAAVRVGRGRRVGSHPINLQLYDGDCMLNVQVGTAMLWVKRCYIFCIIIIYIPQYLTQFALLVYFILLFFYFKSFLCTNLQK